MERLNIRCTSRKPQGPLNGICKSAALYEKPDAADRGKSLSELFSILDDISLRIKLTIGAGPKIGPNQSSFPDKVRHEMYFELKPLIMLLASRKTAKGGHVLSPSTAHNLMETINEVLEYDPAALVLDTSSLCRAAETFSYQFDSMAITEAVRFVERVLADHKEVLRDSTTANALGDMLDTFVCAGWPSAMRLTYRLDQAIR